MSKKLSVVETIGIAAFVVPIMLILAIPSIMLWGWALQVLWSWFVIPVFGFAALTLPQAIGLRLFSGIFTATHATKEFEDKDAKLVYNLTMMFLAPLFVIGMGYVVTLFM